jgi:hypothetical protein
MFIGHFGVGFGAKAAAPKVSLGSLFLAAQFIDLLWPTFLLLSVERVRIEPGATAVTPLDFVSYPISHSLLTVLGWSLLRCESLRCATPERHGPGLGRADPMAARGVGLLGGPPPSPGAAKIREGPLVAGPSLFVHVS